MSLIRTGGSSTEAGNRRVACSGHVCTRSIFWWGSIANCSPFPLSICSLGRSTADRLTAAAKSILFAAIFSALLITTTEKASNRLVSNFGCSFTSIFYLRRNSGAVDLNGI
jgi:hypothetical protein